MSDMALVGTLLCLLAVKSVFASNYDTCDWENDTSVQPAARQLLEFKLEHPKPIGLFTFGTGDPVEIRNVISVNSDVFSDNFFFENQGHLNGERVPMRTVAAKGIGAFGYFEVTNDVSKYTKADVFNGVGKKTKAQVRFSVGGPEQGLPDTNRDFKDLAVKLYTNDGILDILSLNTPVFAFKDPKDFATFAHAFARRNPKTHLLDANMPVDTLTLKPDSLSTIFFFLSDFGVPNGWRHADFFPIHTFELVNKYGDRWYVRFNWRTEQGTEYLTNAQILALNDPDYFIRDMYNAIKNGSNPSWRLDIDVLSLFDIQHVDYNPFDVTRRWKNGTFETVTIGRLVVTKYSENQFRDAEQAAFNPSSLVPGIPGPVDVVFRGRRFAYRDTQNYRISRNHLRVGVNRPDYSKTYNRDGHAPVGTNGRDAPNYFPNSYYGPLPFVDEDRPKEQLRVLETNAVDLQEAADFYNILLPDDGAKQRLAENLVLGSSQSIEKLRNRLVKLLCLIDPDLARRVMMGLITRNLFNGDPDTFCYEKSECTDGSSKLSSTTSTSSSSSSSTTLPTSPPSSPVPSTQQS